MIVQDRAALNLWPMLEAAVRNTLPSLVYAASGREMKMVMVAGNLARKGEAQAQAKGVARRVAADRVHKEIALLEAMKAGLP